MWSAYALVVLIKLHWVFNSPESRFGAVFVPDLKTLYYLDAILNRLGEISVGGKCPCAAAFGFVFMKLKMWHLHRSGQLSDDENDQARRQRSSLLGQDTVQILESAKRMEIPGLLAPEDSTGNVMPSPRPFPAAFMPGGNWDTSTITNAGQPPLGQNLNAAYDAASYGKTNWDQFNFSTEEMDMFDMYMNNSGWMGYLL